jgi:uroporphyrinogen decarboxylase
MNSVERDFTVLRRRRPDRVPVGEFLIDPRVARRAIPGCADVADCMDRLDMDNVYAFAAFERTAAAADGAYRDEWGVLYKEGGPEAIAHPLRGPVATLADARAYVAPDPEAPGRLGALPDLVHRYKGRRAIIFHQRAAFMWSAYLMGMENILLGFLTEPDKVELVMDKVLEANLRLARRAVRAGAEIIVLGDDYAANSGPLMGREIFDHFILPRLKRMVDTIHDEGAFCVKHSDGNIDCLLEPIVAAGPDGLNPIEPGAGMDLKQVKAQVGGRIALLGNIDCAHLLPHGTPAQVREAVRQAIEDAGRGGGFMVTSSNSIHSSCRPENLLAMVAAVKEFGGYD